MVFENLILIFEHFEKIENNKEKTRNFENRQKEDKM
jgi:hypothetical protein